MRDIPKETLARWIARDEGEMARFVRAGKRKCASEFPEHPTRGSPRANRGLLLMKRRYAVAVGGD